jgi:hypothetical protein
MHDMMIGVAKGTLIKLPSEFFISWSSMIDVQSVSLGKLEPGGISLEEIIKSNQTVCSHMRMGRLHATCPKTLHTPITSFNRAYHIPSPTGGTIPTPPPHGPTCHWPYQASTWDEYNNRMHRGARTVLSGS